MPRRRGTAALTAGRRGEGHYYAWEIARGLVLRKRGTPRPYSLTRVAFLVSIAPLLTLLPGCAWRAVAVTPPKPPSRVEPPAFVNVAPQLGIRYSANAASRRPRDILES